MATPVVFNGVNYSVPAFGDVGYAQGPGNLSAYLISLATGTLQPTGGLFSLTADANFGPNFGLVSIYYKSASPNIATAGVLRLAHTDTIDWRNLANTLNLPLAVNASDQLTYNGVVVSTAAVGGTVNPGTINTLTYYAATGNTVSGLTAITPNHALVSDANGLPIASVTTAAEIAFVNGVTSAIQTQLNTKAADSLVVHLAGSEAITGAKTFSAGVGAITLSASTIAMGANKITGLANGTAATDAAAFGQIPVLVAPTIQKFLSGSGTYTTPTVPRSPLYIRVVMVGAGGGGAGSGTAAGTAGGVGGNTTFGTTLLVANGGNGASFGNVGATGGSASLGAGPIGLALSGGNGQGFAQSTLISSSIMHGGMGGANPLGGPGGGGAATSAGTAGVTNTGGGGGGGGGSNTGSGSQDCGAGGGAGGYVSALISSPAVTYAYAVGAAGTAGTAGTSGLAGGAGGSGVIVVEEYYQ